MSQGSEKEVCFPSTGFIFRLSKVNNTAGKLMGRFSCPQADESTGLPCEKQPSWAQLLPLLQVRRLISREGVQSRLDRGHLGQLLLIHIHRPLPEAAAAAWQ